jgi:MarR family transcriptional regulator, organic hydroperoxide resistance regulator
VNPSETENNVEVQATGTLAEDTLAEDALHKFLLLHRHLRQYALQMDHHGVRPREFSVLLFLRENGPATVGQVQEYLYHSPSSTSAILTRMEEAGYVTRTRSEEDNRVVIIALTQVGKELSERGPLGGIPLLRRRLPTLSPARLEVINQALDDIIQLMEVEETA